MNGFEDLKCMSVDSWVSLSGRIKEMAARFEAQGIMLPRTSKHRDRDWKTYLFYFPLKLSGGNIVNKQLENEYRPKYVSENGRTVKILHPDYMNQSIKGAMLTEGHADLTNLLLTSIENNVNLALDDINELYSYLDPYIKPLSYEQLIHLRDQYKRRDAAKRCIERRTKKYDDIRSKCRLDEWME